MSRAWASYWLDGWGQGNGGGIVAAPAELAGNGPVTLPQPAPAPIVIVHPPPPARIFGVGSLIVPAAAPSGRGSSRPVPPWPRRARRPTPDARWHGEDPAACSGRVAWTRP